MPIVGTNFGMPLSIVGQPVGDLSSRQGAGFTMDSPDYFNTFGIAITQGRPFNERDIAGSVPVTIVNEAFVKKFLANLDPLKQRVSVEQIIPGVTKLGPAIDWQIVGVYRNVHNGGVRVSGFPKRNMPSDPSLWPHATISLRTEHILHSPS